jgi:predicted nucleic acid-binding protein
MTGDDAVFLDTNVLVAATVEAHPSHQTAAALLERTVTVLDGLLDLVARRGVRGRQVHDANIVATMVAHRVTRLARPRGALPFAR